jgi:hypothetical protein
MMDHMVTMHFLDDTKFDAVKSLINSGTAYNINTNPVTNKLQIEMRPEVLDACSGGSDGLYSCAIRHDVTSGNIVTPYSVYPLATGFGTYDDSESVDWLTTNLLGVSEYSQALALNMTKLVRNKYNINHKVTYINNT